MEVSLCSFIFKHTHGLANDSLFVGWITNDFAAMMIYNPIFAFLLGMNSGKLCLNMPYFIITRKIIQEDIGMVWIRTFFEEHGTH